MPPPPTPIHTTTTTTDNTTLHLYTHNAPSPTRPSLILLHYWGGSPTTWTPLLAAHPSLRTANAITYHARGWAPSTGPDPDDPGAYGTAAMSRDLAAVVRAAALDDPHLAPAGFVVVGHSMGAKVAQHYAATAGSGCQGLRGLVLVAPAPLGGLRFPPEVKEQQRSAYESAEGVREVLENVLTKGPGTLGEAVREGCVRDSLRGSGWAKAAWPGYAAEEDFGGLVGGIGVPVVVVRGDADFERDLVGELGVERGWVNRVVEGCGHLVPLEKPEVLGVEIVRFMEGLDWLDRCGRENF